LAIVRMVTAACSRDSRGLAFDPNEIQPVTDTVAVASESPVADAPVAGGTQAGEVNGTEPSGAEPGDTQPSTTVPQASGVDDGSGAPVELTPLASCSSAGGQPGCVPTAVSGRKLLDQNGDVYLMRTFSSWAMASNLSDDEITTALEGVRKRGFNAVTVWIGGGYSLGDSWHRYTNAAGDSFWEGEPWQSALGPAWASVDRVVTDSQRLGLTANLSFGGGYGDTGARADWESASNAQMHDVGVAVAKRYQNFDNIIWHVMFDDDVTADSVAGERIDALFGGINEAEGAATRPIRWVEPNNGQSIESQFLSDATFSDVDLTLNGLYDYGSNSTELVEAAWNDPDASSLPFGDVEPPYDGSPHYDGDMGQQLRERSYAVFVEGGSFINYGQEDWWPFGSGGLYSEGLNWDQVPDHQHTVEQSYVWSLIDAYVADPTWAPDDGSFLTTGEESGDTKAAVGRSATAAIAYLPSSRDLTIDTTVVSAPAVRLRWYDPTNGTFSDIAASEAPSASRAIGEFPPQHADGTSDWVLVVDAA
jgi:hypothetical protein